MCRHVLQSAQLLVEIDLLTLTRMTIGAVSAEGAAMASGVVAVCGPSRGRRVVQVVVVVCGPINATHLPSILAT